MEHSLRTTYYIGSNHQGLCDMCTFCQLMIIWNGTHFFEQIIYSLRISGECLIETSGIILFEKNCAWFVAHFRCGYVENWWPVGPFISKYATAAVNKNAFFLIIKPWSPMEKLTVTATVSQRNLRILIIQATDLL